MDEHLLRLTSNLCEQLDVSAEDHFRQFVDVVGKQDGPEDLLNAASRQLQPEGSLYKDEASYWMVFWSIGYYRVLYDTIEGVIKRGTPSGEVVELPENILMPIIDKIISDNL